MPWIEIFQDPAFETILMQLPSSGSSLTLNLNTLIWWRTQTRPPLNLAHADLAEDSDATLLNQNALKWCRTQGWPESRAQKYLPGRKLLSVLPCRKLLRVLGIHIGPRW